MKNLELFEEVSFSEFLKINIAIGTVIWAELNLKARQPAYKLRIDFGALGTKTSSAQITQNYNTTNLVGQQIIAVMNFPIKRVAGVKSEVLILAAVCKKEGTVLIEPNINVANGTRIM